MVVPAAQLMDEACAWAWETLAMSPTALRIARGFVDAATDHVKGMGALGMTALGLYDRKRNRWKGATPSWSGASRISASIEMYEARRWHAPGIRLHTRSA